jgi:hypothetical protein
MKKQTAANNTWLADAKRTFNAKIYKRLAALENAGAHIYATRMAANGGLEYIDGETRNPATGLFDRRFVKDAATGTKIYPPHGL